MRPPTAPHRLPRVCREAGQVKAGEQRESIQRQMLRAYSEHGHGNTAETMGLTDAEMSQLLGIQRSTVNARRAELMKQGLVEAKNIRPNLKSQVFNTVWGLK